MEKRKSRKQEVIETGVQLFNENGFGKVTLHEIAKKLKMTRGNLTYHFKTKEDLLSTIAFGMWKEIKEERDQTRDFPSFQNLHKHVKSFYRLQKKYAFIFLDYHVLNHPIIKEQFREMTERSLKDNKLAIAFAIANGNLKPEPFNGAYNNIAFLTWKINFYWLSQQIIRGVKKEADGEAIIWSIIYPHFTDKGKKAFASFFGESMLDKMGEPFNTTIEDFIAF